MNKDLSLKAKGLLSLMLSLPEDWVAIGGISRECGFLSGTDGSFPVPLALNLTAYNEIKKSCVPFS